MLLHAPSKVLLLFGCMFVSHIPMSSTKLFLLVALKLRNGYKAMDFDG